MGEIEEAKEAFTRAVTYQNEPEDPVVVFIRLAKILQNEQNYTEARKYYLMACQVPILLPFFTDVANVLAHVYCHNGTKFIGVSNGNRLVRSWNVLVTIESTVRSRRCPG